MIETSGRGRGRSRGRGRGGNCKGGRGKARGKGSVKEKKTPKAKATSSKAASAGMPRSKAKAKAKASSSNSKPAAAKPKQAVKKGKPASKCKLGGVRRAPSETALMSTPRKAARIYEHENVIGFASPIPASFGKFADSNKRRGHEKRVQVAAMAMGRLRTASLPGLTLPTHPFSKQSFTLQDPEGKPYSASIGVILKASNFYVYKAKTIPEALRDFAHLDGSEGSTIGWSTYPSLKMAYLGYMEVLNINLRP